MAKDRCFVIDTFAS